MLRIEHIDVFYGETQVLSDISLQINQGEIVTVIGANSAGKSTLLKAVAGLLKPKTGKIEFIGEDITGADDYEIVERGLVRVPEGRKLFSNMTVLENLELGALKGNAKAKRKESTEMVFELFPKLKDRTKQLAGTLSGGEQQMVAIARGLMSVPKLLMFDEPSLGLAPMIVTEVFEAIKRINAAGTTVLLVEQNVNYALTCSARGLVLERGRVVLEGPAHSLLDDDRVRKAYMGI